MTNKNDKPKQATLGSLKILLKDSHDFEDKDSVQFFREKETKKINFFIHFDKSFKQDMLVIKSLYTIPSDTEEVVRELCEAHGLSYTMLFEVN